SNTKHMAATTRATTPPAEPFPPLDAHPHTPTSLAGASNIASGHLSAENPNLLRPHSQKSSASGTGFLSRSDKAGLSPRSTPIALTGQAAMADLKRRRQQRSSPDSRQTSPNPAVEAMHSLMGGAGVSTPADAPAPNKLSEPLRKAAEKIHIPQITQDDSLQVSPVSMGSLGSFGTAGTIDTSGSTSAMTATANNGSSSVQYVDEPAQMSEGGSYLSNGHLAVAGDDGNKAFSYPGPPPQPSDNHEAGPSRGMSYPGIQGSPKSPSSNKRHKCPYCSTDFTRHHNLKSHLLTHSQEKPYVCQTCQSRFRRLHDLKRHTKLHTGERPHTCDKCGRRFARGDALARHNKGPGGCAGRRSSFGGDDDFDGANEGMDGVEYTGDDDDEDGDDAAHGRRVSEPSRKRTQLETPQDSNRQVYRQHSSTYPPPQMQNRPHGSSVSSMGPPQVIHPGSSTATSPREMSGHPSPAAGSMGASSSYYPPYPATSQGMPFAQPVMMTESPKPLSPGQPPDQHRLSVDAAMGAQNRNRSPSLTTQFQQQHFGRGSGRATPPQPLAPPPIQHSLPGPVLPPLPTGQPQARSSAALPGPSSLHHQQLPPHNVGVAHGGGQGSNPGSLSSHGRSSGSSTRDIMGHDGDIWAYVRGLEQRMGKMQEEYELRIRNLQDEVVALKGQVSASQAASYSSDMQRGY
ncbi:hypothetical protein LTR78_002353, partial [Recurvomyces mirabilis]